MKAAYVGILQPGSTSRMRAECLRKLTPGVEWDWVDTDQPMQESARLWRTMAFRYHRGLAVKRINRLVMGRVADVQYDLIWVDKGVFFNPSTIAALRRGAGRLVHYTPDTAFHANRSSLFNASLPWYDLAVTTKSFELDEYHRRIGADKTFLTTQGYDKAVHYPRVPDSDRKREVVFVGLAEPDRERCIAALLAKQIPVRLAGHGWGSFLNRWSGNPNLAFEGEEVFGDDYARILSSSLIALGLLSKRFPELHTTRTFEIPACGAVLATERTAETIRFFDEREALFFDDHLDLVANVALLLHHKDTTSLSAMAAAGRRRVQRDRRDNEGLMAAILADSRLAL